MARDGKEKDSEAIRDRAVDWLLQIDAAPDDTALRARRDAWLREDAAHADAYHRAERAWHLAGDVPPAHADRWAARAGSAPVIRLGTASSRPAAKGSRRPWRFAVAALAACVALLVAMPDLARRLRADYVTGTGQSRQATLADGTTIHLDADSAIAARYTETGRETSLLSGRAFFEVVPDTQRRFSVTAGNATVVVTGTAFSVGLTSDSVAVSVQSGSVQVNDQQGRVLAARLAPGDRLRINRATDALVRDKIVVSQIAAWRHGQLVVENTPIAAVVEELRRYHSGFIVIRDEALARRPVTGVYDLHDPAAALRAVVQPYGGSVREVTPYFLVVSGG